VENLSQLLEHKLNALVSSQQQLQQRSSEQLAQLNADAAQQLSALGQALEAPMTRLIETASETPKAAAQVISELRAEISKNIARDNAMLEERQALMEQLHTIANEFAASSEQQRGALTQVVENSAGTLSSLAEQFADQVERESSRLADIGADVAAGIDEAASLTEGFSAAVEVFGQSNQQLVDTLQTLEASLLQVSSRSDEQLGYYVAQAREVIDHSVQSQKQMLEQLREIGKQQTLFADENG
jgi:ABC-type transporter Mla subunit MlaD